MRTFLILLAMILGQAHADEIYRCGKTYSQQPCPGGKPIDTTSAVGGYEMPQVQAQAQSSSSVQTGQSHAPGIIGGKLDPYGANKAACLYWVQELKLIDREESNPRYAGSSLQQRRAHAKKEMENLSCPSMSSY